MRKGFKNSDKTKLKMSIARRGSHASEETKRKMSESHKGEKNSFYGKYHSKETKEKLSIAHKDKHLSEETKQKISNFLKGNQHSLGYKHSDKAKKEMSRVRKGKKPSEKTIEKIKKALKGRIFSKDHREKLSKAHKGKHLSEEHKQKIRIKTIAFLASGKTKTKDTSIEITIEKELKSQNIPYLKQAPVEGIALVDFLLSNKVIIQCDGDYWHSQKMNKGRDIAQDTILFFKGYKVFRFTETEIKKSPFKCIKKVISYIS